MSFAKNGFGHSRRFSRKIQRNLAARSSGTFFEQLEDRIVFSAPPLPVITGATILVTSSPYNAVGNGSTNNTTGIQNAINAASAAGGGTVEIPRGFGPI